MSRKRFRRSPHLVSYWRAGRLVVHNYATGAELVVSPRAREILDAFDTWRTAEDYVGAAKESLAAVRRLLSLLSKATLLQASDRIAAREDLMTSWGAWNPAAGFFHMATRDVKFVDPIEGQRQLERKARRIPLPPPVKRYPGAQSSQLPRVNADAEFPRVLLARRTWRQFAERPLKLESLATLLGLTGGIQQWASLRGQGDLPLKTSPSGGARHPLELYVVVREVEGLAPGVYHYANDCHRMELIASHRRRVPVSRYMHTQFWYEGASALVFFSAVFERYLWKYTYARAYRAILIEAGHQCQTFCLTATWLGLAPFCTMALADSQIEKDLGLDGITESVLYCAGVGVRPAGGKVLSKPAKFPPLRVRPNTSILEQPFHEPTSTRIRR